MVLVDANVTFRTIWSEGVVIVVTDGDGVDVGHSRLDGVHLRSTDEALRRLGFRRRGDSTAEPVDTIRFDDGRFELCVTRYDSRQIFFYAGMDEFELSADLARALAAGLSEAADLSEGR